MSTPGERLVMRGCDDVDAFYDVTFLLPVTVRYWAATEQAAKDQFKDTQVQLVGPMQNYSIGLPQNLSIKEVTPTEARK